MTLIKILLVASFIATLLWAFRNRNRVGLRASYRIGLVVVAAAAITSVVDPLITTRVARFVGVTRGTDLVLYMFVVIFGATAVGTYFRFREVEGRLAAMVQSSAIRDAVLSQGVPGSRRTPVEGSDA